MRYDQKYAWSILLRLFHWSFALSIVALVVTGFYIHFPWTNTYLEGDSSFPVATMRSKSSGGPWGMRQSRAAKPNFSLPGSPRTIFKMAE